MADPLQLGFTDYEQIHAKKRTRRQRFLDEMEITVPWEAFLALIKPVYHKPSSKGGRPPIPLEVARMAIRPFGKGRHRAGLNLGDCFSYALAKSLATPLLHKGEDFILTDLAPAIQAAR